MKHFVGLSTVGKFVVGPNTVEISREEFIAETKAQPDLVLAFDVLQEAQAAKERIAIFMRSVLEGGI